MNYQNMQIQHKKKQLRPQAAARSFAPGKIHCKAVRKLNEIQPTTVKDEEKLFCKDGDVIIKADYMDTTKEFINVMANSGFEYAQKASADLKSKRESDQPFKQTILQNASCDIQNVKEIVIQLIFFQLIKISDKTINNKFTQLNIVLRDALSF